MLPHNPLVLVRSPFSQLQTHLLYSVPLAGAGALLTTCLLYHLVTWRGNRVTPGGKKLFALSVCLLFLAVSPSVTFHPGNTQVLVVAVSRLFLNSAKQPHGTCMLWGNSPSQAVPPSQKSQASLQASRVCCPQSPLCVPTALQMFVGSFLQLLAFVTSGFPVCLFSPPIPV